jgi:hypothetical protein
MLIISVCSPVYVYWWKFQNLLSLLIVGSSLAIHQFRSSVLHPFSRRPSIPSSACKFWSSWLYEDGKDESGEGPTTAWPLTERRFWPAMRALVLHRWRVGREHSACHETNWGKLHLQRSIVLWFLLQNIFPDVCLVSFIFEFFLRHARKLNNFVLEGPIFPIGYPKFVCQKV